MPSEFLDFTVGLPRKRMASWTGYRHAGLPPLLARRITEALHARADGSTRCLEDGVRVT